eukprot:jgi/Mesvir1/18459/Mv14314-RA.1
MIVVFGGICVDIIMSVQQLPKAGETVLCPGYKAIPGGKGANQALATARFAKNTKVAFVGKVGKDFFAETALHLLRKEGVDLDSTEASDMPTAVACVLVDTKGENQIVVASGANFDVRAEQVARREPPLGKGDIVLLQMEVMHEENWKVVSLAKAAGARVVMNLAPAAPVPEAMLPLLDVLIVNETEAMQLSGQWDPTFPHDPNAAEEVVLARMRDLSQRFGMLVIVTLGAGGSVAFGPASDELRAGLRVSALHITPVDTVGAGDVYTGAFTASMAAGDDLPTSLIRASVASGLACMHVGAQTGIPTAGEVDANMSKVKVTPLSS